VTFERRISQNGLRLVGRAWNDVARELQEILQALLDSNDNGLPAGFGDVTPDTITPDSSGDAGDETKGWAAADHDHPIATDTTAALGSAASEGTSTSFSRADHVHKRAIETTNGGFVRRRLNFGSGFTVADDAGSDEIDVTLSTTPADVEVFAWFMGD